MKLTERLPDPRGMGLAALLGGGILALLVAPGPETGRVDGAQDEWRGIPGEKTDVSVYVADLQRSNPWGGLPSELEANGAAPALQWRLLGISEEGGAAFAVFSDNQGHTARVAVGDELAELGMVRAIRPGVVEIGGNGHEQPMRLFAPPDTP